MGRTSRSGCGWWWLAIVVRCQAVRWIVAALLGTVWVATAQAEPLGDLDLPIDCEPGMSCWMLRYVDHDPGPGVRDYRCGGRSGDGHKGTDFAIRDLAVMAAGVEVRAAAAGVVLAIRDGVPDVGMDQLDPATLAKAQCGNGIRLDHGDGWETWYCHLRRGSLAVQEGDQVAAGQPLGLVGFSGETSFPHLHFDVRHDGQPVDPFVGPEPAAVCEPGARPLWRDDVAARLDYPPILLTNAGIAPAAPEKDDIRRGWHHQDVLSVGSPALVLWVEGYWFEPGDKVNFRLTDPEKTAVVERSFDVEQTRQRWFWYAGAPRPDEWWPSGLYDGEVMLERGSGEDSQRMVIKRSVELR